MPLHAKTAALCQWRNGVLPVGVLSYLAYGEHHEARACAAGSNLDASGWKHGVLPEGALPGVCGRCFPRLLGTANEDILRCMWV